MGGKNEDGKDKTTYNSCNVKKSLVSGNPIPQAKILKYGRDEKNIYRML